MTSRNLLPPRGTCDTEFPSSTPSPTIYTPFEDTSPHRSKVSSRRSSPYGIKTPTTFSLPSLQPGRSSSPEDLHRERFGRGFAQRSGLRLGLEDEDEDMPGRLPMHSPGDGHSQLPLLKDERGRASYDSPHGSARPAFAARRSTFRSRSPEQNNTSATRDKYAYSVLFLLISLVSFTVQTETAVYIQHELGWNKAYCML